MKLLDLIIKINWEINIFYKTVSYAWTSMVGALDFWERQTYVQPCTLTLACSWALQPQISSMKLKVKYLKYLL